MGVYRWPLLHRPGVTALPITILIHDSLVQSPLRSSPSPNHHSPALTHQPSLTSPYSPALTHIQTSPSIHQHHQHTSTINTPAPSTHQHHQHTSTINTSAHHPFTVETPYLPTYKQAPLPLLASRHKYSHQWRLHRFQPPSRLATPLLIL
jgi:hypothetical protein